MGNRGSLNKIYNAPSFYSIRQIRDIYSYASDDAKNKMDKVITLKTNFRVYISSTGLLAIWLNDNESMDINTAPLSVILKSQCDFEDISLIQFNLLDQKLF